MKILGNVPKAAFPGTQWVHVFDEDLQLPGYGLYVEKLNHLLVWSHEQFDKVVAALKELPEEKEEEGPIIIPFPRRNNEIP